MSYSLLIGCFLTDSILIGCFLTDLILIGYYLSDSILIRYILKQLHIFGWSSNNGDLLHFQPTFCSGTTLGPLACQGQSADSSVHAHAWQALSSVRRPSWADWAALQRWWSLASYCYCLAPILLLGKEWFIGFEQSTGYKDWCYLCTSPFLRHHEAFFRSKSFVPLSCLYDCLLVLLAHCRSISLSMLLYQQLFSRWDSTEILFILF